MHEKSLGAQNTLQEKAFAKRLPLLSLLVLCCICSFTFKCKYVTHTTCPTVILTITHPSCCTMQWPATFLLAKLNKNPRLIPQNHGVGKGHLHKYLCNFSTFMTILLTTWHKSIICACNASLLSEHKPQPSVAELMVVQESRHHKACRYSYSSLLRFLFLFLSPWVRIRHLYLLLQRAG